VRFDSWADDSTSRTEALPLSILTSDVSPLSLNWSIFLTWSRRSCSCVFVLIEILTPLSESLSYADETVWDLKVKVGDSV